MLVIIIIIIIIVIVIIAITEAIINFKGDGQVE